MQSDPELITSATPQDYHLHYALEHAPFSIESDTALFVLSAGHEEALDKLYRGLQARKSFMLVTGAPGTGKTLLLQTLQTLGADRFDYLQLYPQDLHETSLSAQLLEAAGSDLQSNDVPANRLENNLALRNYLQKARTDGRRMVVVVDDAQELTDTQLDELRQWSNLDDHNGSVLQFLLAGHLSLAERLNRPQLANLKQRIGCRFKLPALTLNETQRYIAHRCLLAGASRLLFDRAIVIRLYSLTRGLPRLINTVADALLLQAFLRGSRSVEVEDVRLVSRDLDLSYAPIIKRPARSPKRRFGKQAERAGA